MAETVGEIVCECGRRAYIEKTRRKGNYLQKRCGTSRNDGCGLNQQTGDWIQAYWRKNMVPVGSLVVGKDYQAHPRDLEMQARAQVPDLQSDPEPQPPVPEYPETEQSEQAKAPEPEQAPEPAEPEQPRRIVEEDSGSGIGKFLLGLSVVGMALAGIRSAI